LLYNLRYHLDGE